MTRELIDRDMLLPEIIKRYPGCRKIFDRYGLLGCGGPEGPHEPVWFFARAHRINSSANSTKRLRLAW